MSNFLEMVGKYVDTSYQITINPSIIRDSLSQHQLLSKQHLVRMLKFLVESEGSRLKNPRSLSYHGCWTGLGAGLIKEAFPSIEDTLLLDIDPNCIPFALNFLKNSFSGSYGTILADVTKTLPPLGIEGKTHLAVNTSAEHFSKGQFSDWWELLKSKVRTTTIVAVQGTDMPDKEHINPITSSQHLVGQLPGLDKVISTTLEFAYCKRFTVIGKIEAGVSARQSM